MNQYINKSNNLQKSNTICNENPWQSNKRSSLNRNYNNYNSDNYNNIPVTNRFDSLTVEDDFNQLNDRVYNDDVNIINSQTTVKNQLLD